MTQSINYSVSLRKETPSAVGGLDDGGVVLVNQYPMPPQQMPHDVTLAEFQAMPVTQAAAARRAKVYALERSLRDVPGTGTGPEPTHIFTPGVYLRRLILPAGFVCVSKRHARQHIFIISRGCVSVFTEDGMTLLEGPHEFVSPAGAKRVLHVHEEALLTTVHPTWATTVEDAERELILSEMEVLQ